MTGRFIGTKILTEGVGCVILVQDKCMVGQSPRHEEILRVREVSTMEHIKTIATRDLTKSVKTGGCGECQTSCQSACKTSCGVANQQCENSNK